VRIDAAFVEKARERIGVAMGDEHALGPGVCDRRRERIPVRVVGQREPAIVAAAAARAADAHPSRGERGGMVAKPAHPDAAARRERRDDQLPGE
jgi:hypothetical protein